MSSNTCIPLAPARTDVSISSAHFYHLLPHLIKILDFVIEINWCSMNDMARRPLISSRQNIEFILNKTWFMIFLKNFSQIQMGVLYRVQKCPTFFWSIFSGKKYPLYFWDILSGTKTPKLFLGYFTGYKNTPHFSGVFCRVQKAIFRGRVEKYLIFSGVFCRVQKYPHFFLEYFVG